MTAWRRITGSIECPTCGETQNPGKECRNVECGAKIPDIKNPLEGLRFHDVRHCPATKLLERGTPLAVVAQILGWSASTAVRMAKRYGHIRPEAQGKLWRDSLHKKFRQVCTNLCTKPDVGYNQHRLTE